MISDLKYAARILRRSPGFAALVVFMLALGIGANTAMFSVVDAWLLEPLHFPDASRLVIILKSEAKNPSEPKIFPGYRDWEEMARGNHSFTGIAGAFWRGFETRDGEDGPMGMIVTANLFDTLGVKPERGRTFRPDDLHGPAVAVLGHEYWKNRLGGAADIVGRTLQFGSKSYQIIGVMPPRFGLRMINQENDTQFYALIQNDEPAYSASGIGPLAAIGRLRQGVSVEAAEAEINGIQHSLDERYNDNPKGYRVLVTNLQNDNTRNVRASIELSAAALGFLLLIVCANVGSLLLGRMLRRQREMAIRTALGSSSGRIVRQLLTESTALTVVGAAGGVLIAYAGIHIFATLNPFGRMPPNAIALDWRALAFTLIASLASTLIFGLAPAIQAARVDLNEAMKSSGRGVTAGLGAFRLRGLLVSSQVALSMILVVGAALMMETLVKLESHPLGYRTEGITVASVAIPKERWNDVPARREIYSRLLDKFRATAGVEDASISDSTPLDAGFEGPVSIEGRPAPSEDAAPKGAIHSVTPGYFETLAIPLLSGRRFTQQDDQNANPVAILNQNAAARWFAGHSAIGERVKLGDDKEWRTVVGVVGDTSSTFYNTLEWLNSPRVFVPSKQFVSRAITPMSNVYAIIRGRTMTAETVRAVVQSAGSGLRLGQVRSLPEMVAEVVQQPRLRTRLLAALATLSLLLASIGIYGVMAQSVIQRTQEIGIRMALGARAADVVRMMVGQGLRLAVAGIAAGVLGAMAMTRIIASLLYDVKPTDIATFVAAALVSLIAVLLAALIPARAAARVDPMIALRQE